VAIDMTRVAALIFAVIALGACATTTSPTPVPGTLLRGGFDLLCDKASTWPLAPTCAAAANAALPPAPGVDAGAIDNVEYRFGAYCPPSAPCMSAPPNYGYLIIRLKAGGVLLVTVSADAAGKVTVESSQPFASTPPGM
jgi:hypothetical protein